MYYMFIFILQSLSPAQKIIQSCHAAIEATQKRSMLEHPNIVLIEVEDQNKLSYFQSICEINNIDFHLFYEPDNNLGATSLATIPIEKKYKKIFKNLKLMS